MAVNYHEQLAEKIVEELMEARDYDEYHRATEELVAVANALKVAEGNSRLECDLRRFMELDPYYYNDDDIDSIMLSLSAKLGGQIHFRTLTLFNNLNSRLIKKLQVPQDLWQTSKIIYTLGTLYDYNNDDNLKKVIYAIKDEQQRRSATIVARVYFRGYEEVFNIFDLDKEI